ncbi:conserved hypothetical protein [Methylocella tundrae]|nr:hypothetical protein [Methylocella tundrae]WPP04512.1 hypothetical protein SIN04_19115 [Methylocella tundrae]VTZ26991.1 conserved hypothetical protein [Methylocella tundrae]VTZ49809.1 conserved hypothetical protein [Methylocella tundrae]
MGRSLRHERQVLNTDEISLVEASHHPGLAALSDKDLAELRKLVRDRRDRARDIAARQRREIRGKADPRGARAVTQDAGSRAKRDVLAGAMQRINKEAARRESRAARDAMKDSVARALELRRKREARAARPAAGRTPNEGMQAKDSARTKQRDRAKLGAVSQHTRNMQAKRDNQ